MNTLIQTRLVDETTPLEEARELLLQLDCDTANVELVRDIVAAALASSALHTPANVLADLNSIGRSSIDCSGTGGSGIAHFNTSTTTAFVLSALGVTVSKFGNRAATSASGSFDLLSKIGFPVHVDKDRLPETIQKTHLGLLFAPSYYPNLARLAPIRKSLGKPTVLNYLGPLLNPTFPAFRLMGVSNKKMLVHIAGFLASHNPIKRALLVRGESGLDEIESSGRTQAILVESAYTEAFTIDLPELPTAANALTFSKEELTPARNATIFDDIVSGADVDSIFARQVLFNSAAALMIVNRVNSLEQGYVLAREALLEGAVAEHVDFCRREYARISC